MARRNRPAAARRVQRSKISLPVRLERVIDQLIGDATDALTYMGSEKSTRN